MQNFIVFFLLPLIFTVHAEVVTNFQRECKEFFYNGLEPQVQASNNDYVHICQRLGNQYHFATLYDTANRIPVYSAYIYEKNNERGREKRWFIEPQLVNQNWGNDMMTERQLKKKHPNVFMGDKQAINSDYNGLQKEKGFNRGHLNPNQHHQGLGRKATFTLTNIVPQNKGLNGGSWAKYETNLTNTFKDCKTAYVVVGAIPSNENWVEKENQTRVNIPDYLWHAYCCLDNNGKPYKSGAAHVRNENTTVVECSIDSLKGFFDKVKPKINQVFFEDCKAKSNNVKGDCASVVP